MNVARDSGIWWLLALFMLAAALAFPFLAGPYLVHLAVGVLMTMTVAISWDILARTGQVSVGHAGLFGIGAYGAAILHTRYGIPPLLAILLGALTAIVVALLLGLVCLRMRGIYFSIATLSFAEALQVVALMQRDITGGAMGLSVPPLFGGDRVLAYYLILVVTVAAVATAFYVGQSRLHFAFTAIRDNEDVAGVTGINQTLYKILAFVISAFFTGVAGGFYSYYFTFIDPPTTFGLGLSVSAMVMPIFGGLYTLAGPIIGTILIKGLEEYLRITFARGHFIAYGLVLMLAVLLLPNGLVGLWRSHTARRHQPTTQKLTGAPVEATVEDRIENPVSSGGDR